MSLSPHHETDWSLIRASILIPQFWILIISAVKICKQYVQNASACGDFVPILPTGDSPSHHTGAFPSPRPLSHSPPLPQMKLPGVITGDAFVCLLQFTEAFRHTAKTSCVICFKCWSKRTPFESSVRKLFLNLLSVGFKRSTDRPRIIHNDRITANLPPISLNTLFAWYGVCLKNCYNFLTYV